MEKIIKQYTEDKNLMDELISDFKILLSKRQGEYVTLGFFAHANNYGKDWEFILGTAFGAKIQNAIGAKEQKSLAVLMGEHNQHSYY